MRQMVVVFLASNLVLVLLLILGLWAEQRRYQHDVRLSMKERAKWHRIHRRMERDWL